jgi:DNA-binding LytR/AlgR family response regulator
MLRCYIIDDEALAIKVIENHLSQVTGIEVEATFTNAIEAFDALRHSTIDLIFLDIQMPGLNGLSLLSALPVQPLVILTTAHREFALESYQFRVVDYLLKPISFDRFLKAIGKAMHLTDMEQRAAAMAETIPQLMDNQPFIYIKSERQFVKILLDEVLYVESLRNHVRFVTRSGNHTTLVSISDMEARLPPQRFLRIHKSCIIAIQKVEQFTSTNITISGRMLSIGAAFQERAMAVLGRHVV